MRKPTTARIAQLLFLLAFVILFIQTEYRGRDQINAAVNAFFRADPLVMVSYLLSAKGWTWLLLPAALMTVATLFLGRFFCGWICPLGTVLDLLTTRIAKSGPVRFLKGNTKYWILVPFLSVSLFNLNLAGLLDPMAILLRGLTFFLYPLLGFIARTGWVNLYGVIGEQRDALAPAYKLLQEHLLPFRDTFYPLALFSAVLLLAVIWLERYEERTWCRNLCPLGTLLGWLARFSPFTRKPDGLCEDCGRCREFCPTAFETEIRQKPECILCMKCQEQCPLSRVSFAPTGFNVPADLAPDRRVLLQGMAAGLLLSVPFRFRSPEKAQRLRPPGVRDEDEFLRACIRCGECMKVCLKNALYPAAWQTGLDGIYTPVVIPRLGYCEYNCTLCGQVCPTGAIPLLPVETKRREVIGKAVLDRNHCLPYARRIDCIVCEEHCPIPTKAIRSREVQLADSTGGPGVVKEPYVVEELCNGCGICENVCPVETRAGIRIHAVKDRKPVSREYSDTALDAYGGRER